MPYYARTKGRTQEIPPDGGRSPLPPSPSSRSLPDLDTDVRAAFGTTKHDDVTYRHSVWTRCRCCRAGRGPLGILRRVVVVPLIDVLRFVEEASGSVPPIIPALVASLFLMVALPMMIAWDFL